MSYDDLLLCRFANYPILETLMNGFIRDGQCPAIFFQLLLINSNPIMNDVFLTTVTVKVNSLMYVFLDFPISFNSC